MRENMNKHETPRGETCRTGMKDMASRWLANFELFKEGEWNLVWNFKKENMQKHETSRGQTCQYIPSWPLANIELFKEASGTSKNVLQKELLTRTEVNCRFNKRMQHTSKGRCLSHHWSGYAIRHTRAWSTHLRMNPTSKKTLLTRTEEP